MDFEIYMSEISKQTLGSYVGKAAQSYANASVDKARHERDSDETSRMTHNAPRPVKDALNAAAEKSRKASYDSDNKRAKRGRGIMLAVKKLSEDVELTESIEDALEELLALNGIELED